MVRTRDNSWKRNHAGKDGRTSARGQTWASHYPGERANHYTTEDRVTPGCHLALHVDTGLSFYDFAPVSFDLASLIRAGL